MGQSEVREKDGIDLLGAQSGPLEESGGEGSAGQAGIDQDVAVPGADQGRGGVRRPYGLCLIPQTIPAECSDTDDVEADGHGWDAIVRARTPDVKSRVGHRSCDG